MTGDTLLGLLGLSEEDPAVQAALTTLARGMRPELDMEEPDDYVDWVTINEIGLEFGFEDEAYLKALDIAQRRQGPLLLSQLYFYGDTPKTRPFPYALPFGLSFADDRDAVRARLARLEDVRRSYIRDAWRLPAFDMTVAYGAQHGRLESVFCHVPYVPWPPAPDARVIPATELDEFVALFGRKWSDPELRTRLAAYDIDHRIGEIRSEHEADLRLTDGLELTFTNVSAPAREKRSAAALVFAAVTFYASRELDARQWPGPLPLALRFDDTPGEVLAKVGVKPVSHEDEALTGFVVWRLDTFTVSVLYSTVENRVLRVTLKAPWYE